MYGRQINLQLVEQQLAYRPDQIQASSKIS